MYLNQQTNPVPCWRHAILLTLRTCLTDPLCHSLMEPCRLYLSRLKERDKLHQLTLLWSFGVSYVKLTVPCWMVVFLTAAYIQTSSVCRAAQHTHVRMGENSPMSPEQAVANLDPCSAFHCGIPLHSFPSFPFFIFWVHCNLPSSCGVHGSLSCSVF